MEELIFKPYWEEFQLGLAVHSKLSDLGLSTSGSSCGERPGSVRWVEDLESFLHMQLSGSSEQESLQAGFGNLNFKVCP